MSDDELDRIKKKQLDELLKHQHETEIREKLPVMDLDSLNFHDAISQNKLLLVDFWAEWCGPCKQIGPILEEISDEKKNLVNVYKMNIDNNPEIPQKYGVRGIPTLMFFNDGKLVDTKVGSLSKSSLNEWIDSNLNI